MRKNIRYALELFLLFILYLLTARLGLNIDPVNKFATLVWIPSGISLVALLVFGYRLWPAITLGALVANMFSGASFPIAFAISVGNTCESVIATYIFKRANTHLNFEHLRDVLSLVFFAAPISVTIAATIGVTTLLLNHLIQSASYFNTWRAWWIGDYISIIIIAPCVLTWIYKRPFVLPTLRKSLETFFLIVFTIITSLIIFYQKFFIFSKDAPTTYLVFPPLLWASLRFGQRAAITTTFLISSIAIFATIQGFGPFTFGQISDRLVELQSFIGIIAMTTMILASTDMERRQFEERKDEFISLASHELKTPLTSIKVFTQLMQKFFVKKQDTTALKYLNRMEEQVNKLNGLISSLLDISAIQAQKLELHKEYFAIDMLIIDNIDMLTQIASHKFVVKNNVKKSLEVYADRERISQVILNLCNNAIKYSPLTKNIVVRIQTRANSVIVSVKDFGNGIAKDYQKKIFQRYFRVGDERNKTYPGLGIGLYISYEIIKRNGGDMWVKSEKGRGSTFYFSLPLPQLE